MSATPTGPSGFNAQWLAHVPLATHGDVVTFYSYKGGTGRSMALVNCAGLMAQQLPQGSRPILLVDFDLEAPGLTRYLAPFLPPSDHGAQPGVLELFDALRSAVDAALPAGRDGPDAPARLDDESAARVIDSFDLSPYIVATTVTNLHVIPAGRFDEDYGKRLMRFNWERLYDSAPALFRALAERFARDYSFTFIDSRTGLSDTSGICTMLMPDSLVMVFTPNAQSITGVKRVVEQAAEYRAQGSDSRPLRVYPLPSRVDNQVELFRRIWRAGDPVNTLFGPVEGYEPMFRQLFESILRMTGEDAGAALKEYFDVVQVPHSADYAYGERLCFLSTSPSDTLSIRNSYEQFLRWLTTGAQPWERPAFALVNHRAASWLHQIGADEPPAIEAFDGPPAIEPWKVWFARLSTALSNPQEPVLLEHAALSRDRQFDVALVMALAHAWRDELAPSREWLLKAESTWHDELEPTIPDGAPAVLLRLWLANRPAAELRSDARESWLADAQRLMQAWQPLRNQRRAWLTAVAALASHAGWPSIERSALEELVEVSRQALGEEHRDTLSASIDLASALRAHGELAAARTLQERILEISERALGAEDEYTLIAMNNLAATLRDLREFQGATSLLGRAIEVVRTRGEDDAFLLTLMTNLAGVARTAGDLAAARDLQETIVQMSERRFGKDDPDTSAAANNLAGTLLEMGDLPRAQQLQEQVLKARQQFLGAEHPDTLTAESNLAATLRATGGVSAARALQEKVLDVRMRMFGDSNPDTLTAMSNLAETLQALGDYSAALALQQRTLDIRRRLLGAEHPDTIAAMSSLARTFFGMARLDEAVALFSEAVALRQRVFGPTALATLTDMNNLAVVLQQSGHLDQALSLQESMLEASRSEYGERHPLTLRLTDGLTTTLLRLDRPEAARAALEKALPIAREVLGDEDMDTLRMTIKLGAVMSQLGKRESAVELFERSWNRMLRLGSAGDRETWELGVMLAAEVLELNDARRAVEVLDTFSAPALTTGNAHWLGLRLKAAEKLGENQDVALYQRRLNELLTRGTTRLL